MPPKRMKLKAASRRVRRAGARNRQGAEGKRSNATVRQVSPLTGGFHSSHSSAVAGQEDAQFSLLKWEYIYNTTLTSLASVGFCVKGNSAFTPGNIATVGFGVVTAPSGFARQFTQYDRAVVVSSTAKMSAFGFLESNGYPLHAPLALGCVPATSAAAITYSTALPAAAMSTVAHGKTVYQNPGSTKVITSAGNSAALIYGDSKESLIEQYAGTTAEFGVATDPTRAWYHTLGVSNPTTSAVALTLRIAVTYRIKWFRPALTATLTGPIDRFGMELPTGSQRSVVRLPSEQKPTVESKGSQVLPVHKELGRAQPADLSETKAPGRTPAKPAKGETMVTPATVVLSGEQLEDYRDWAYVSDDPDTWSEYSQAEAFFKKAASFKLKLDNAVGPCADTSLGSAPAKPAAKPG